MVVRRTSLTLALLACCVAPSTATARTICGLGDHDEVVARTKTAVITKRPNSHGSDTYRGCLRSVGRWRTLFAGSFDVYSANEPVLGALGGRYAAVSIFRGNHDNSGYVGIRVVNLRTGHRRATLWVGHNDGDFGGRQYAMTAIAISRYATLGWVAQEYSHDPMPDPPTPRSSMVAHDANGTRVLDSGGWDSVTEPRFRGAALNWSHDGEPRQATLGTK
jgi:hypothetical protein